LIDEIAAGKDKKMLRIESLLSARLFLVPQLVQQRVYFLSNLSGHLSLYAMDYGGSVPEPLLPPDIALQNPHLMDGYSFYVFPDLEKILVMIDQDGDENYQPMVIPISGGFPEPFFGDKFENFQVHLLECDIDKNRVYLTVESREEQMFTSFQGNLDDGALVELGQSQWGNYVDGVSQNHSKVILIDPYTVGDHVLYLWEAGYKKRKLLYGTPIEEREGGTETPLNAIASTQFTPGGGLLFVTALFLDTYGLGYFSLGNPQEVKPIAITGTGHDGMGELENIEHLNADRYLLKYNIDGSSWLYEGTFDEKELSIKLDTVICGQGELSDGVLESLYYDKSGDRLALSFSTATSPTQIYSVEGEVRLTLTRHTNERILGEVLSVPIL
jgi:hypothetical protein